MMGNESRKDLISEPFANLKIKFCQPPIRKKSLSLFVVSLRLLKFNFFFPRASSVLTCLRVRCRDKSAASLITHGYICTCVLSASHAENCYLLFKLSFQNPASHPRPRLLMLQLDSAHVTSGVDSSHPRMSPHHHPPDPGWWRDEDHEMKSKPESLNI